MCWRTSKSSTNSRITGDLSCNSKLVLRLYMFWTVKSDFWIIYSINCKTSTTPCDNFEEIVALFNDLNKKYQVSDTFTLKIATDCVNWLIAEKQLTNYKELCFKEMEKCKLKIWFLFEKFLVFLCSLSDSVNKLNMIYFC